MISELGSSAGCCTGVNSYISLPFGTTIIPLDDKETMSIFSSTKALGVTPEQIHSQVGSYGIPEFGTKFVRRNVGRYKTTKI